MKNSADTSTLTPVAKEPYKKAEEIISTGEFLSPPVTDEETVNIVEVKKEHNDLELAAIMENGITSTSVIKIEPKWNQFETKPFLEDTLMHEECKTEPELMLDSKPLVKNEECLLDQSDQILSTALDVKIEVPAKSENCEIIPETRKRSDSENVFEEWKIKHEKLEITEENFEHNQIIMSSGGITQEKRDQYKKHKCHVCEYQTNKKSNLKTHLVRHKNPEEIDFFYCHHCYYQTSRKDLLKAHLLRHQYIEEVAFKCNECDFETIYDKSFKSHLDWHKNPEGNMLQCHQCEYRTPRKYALKQHLLRHKSIEEVDMFKCDFCDFKTVHKKSVKRHLLRHEVPEKLVFLQCDKCAYRTIDRGNLKKHLLRHKKNCMLGCTQCNIKTIHKNLKKRLRHKNPE